MNLYKVWNGGNVEMVVAKDMKEVLESFPMEPTRIEKQNHKVKVI